MNVKRKLSGKSVKGEKKVIFVKTVKSALLPLITPPAVNYYLGSV